MNASRLARAFLALALGLVLVAQARAQQPSEHAIKAAFLYKFAGYVEWPEPSRLDAPFVIGTLAADEVAAELSAMLPGRAVAGRPAVVRPVRAGEGFENVQMLFVGRSASDARAAIRAAQRQGVFVVTENGLESGAAINFVVAENRVAFEVSLEAAARTGHEISSRMLAVARRVLPKGPS